MKKIAIGDRRFVITKNLIMMLVMLVVIFVAIFAWYSNNSQVTASGTTISAKSSDQVELALPVKNTSTNTYSFPIDNSKWGTEIDFKLSEYFKDLVKDVTSNGKQFVIPNFETGSVQTGRQVIASDVWEPGLSSQEALTNTSTLDDDQYNYISFDFYVRAKQNIINITSESFLAAGSEKGIVSDGVTGDPKSLVGSNVYRKSTYGGSVPSQSFSADAIVGAMRVSLVGAPVDGVVQQGSGESAYYTETGYAGHTVGPNTDAWGDASQLSFLWLPRPDVYLNTTNYQNTWTLETGIKPNDSRADQTYCHKFYLGNQVGQEGNKINKTLTETTYWDTAVKAPQEYTKPNNFYVSKVTANTDLSTVGSYPTLNQTAPLLTNSNGSSRSIGFTRENQDPVSGYYVYKYTLNLWIEGEDAEARRSMNDGVFCLELDFGS